MNLITLDVESYFSDDYTAKKMTTEAYVRDPRFEVHGVGVDGTWLTDDQFFEFCRRVDWPQTAVLCHHAQFDGLILSHRYGVKPAMWYDTMSMARMVHPNHERVSLDNLCKLHGLPTKTIDYSAETGFKGWHWRDMSEAMRKMLADGCLGDVARTRKIFDQLRVGFPEDELKVIDLTVRMFTEPKLVGDIKLFEKIRDDEFLSKNEMLYNLGVGERDLASNDKFAAILEGLGVDVEMKSGKNGPIPAVAKGDAFMRELLESDDEVVQKLCEARVDVRSTINETRSARLAEMAKRGPLCVYLGYAAAATRRWGGGDGTNFQNLRRGPGLRQGVKAPPGYLFAAPDQSQGECRLLNWFAGQEDVVERFRRGEDPYLPMASEIFRRPITKADKMERQLGKVGELQCGFGSAEHTIKRAARNGTPSCDITIEEAVRIKEAYRNTHKAVVALWKEAALVLQKLANKMEFDWRILRGKGGKLYHPNGTWLDYTTLRWEADDKGAFGWTLRTRSGFKKMYGAKLVENVIQWLSRIVTAEAMIKLDAAGFPIVGMAHDDLWLLVEGGTDDEVAGDVEFIKQTMAATPWWAPGLPLGADCKIGETYS